ncbi:sensor histidine kinase [Kitasatospora sp. NPDC096147]|uniref:sensor histidine kinase n=1 Tax=Kitasatospora sp. NPDC096147 TaxID=3364093 RepID=UPI0037F3B0F4
MGQKVDPVAGPLLYAVAGLPVAVLGGGYALAVLYAGGLLSLTVLGLPLLAAGLHGARGLGGVQRWSVARLLGEQIARPEPLPPATGPLGWVRDRLTDPVGWRSLLHLGVRLPVGLLTFAVVLLPLGCAWLLAFPGVALLMAPEERPSWWLTAAGVLLGGAVLAAVPTAFRAVIRLNRYLARQLLGPAASQRRVRQLERARATLLAGTTGDLRRLERDLHDGTQAELVAIAITLTLTEDALAPETVDAERLRVLLERARRQTDTAITGLRRLTRGIHPVALDEGLAAALPTLTGTAPVPVALTVELPERPDPAIERAVYFCAAELLTNLAKHSGASRAEVELRARGGKLTLRVQDDGRGGATTGAAGGGLAGLAERLAAVDGTLRVDSPPGGPTTVTAELPLRL